MYYVYILKSLKDSRYYVGCTNNIDKRLKQHNSNSGINRYTKGKGPWKVVYNETHDSLSEARHRERQIKSWKKRRAIEKLISAAFV